MLLFVPRFLIIQSILNFFLVPHEYGPRFRRSLHHLYYCDRRLVADQKR